MNPSEQNKKALLDKYIRGIISTEEMHLLNQFALDDDFLFDALEGLSENESTNASAINEIQERIKTRKKKRIPLMYWIAAAASLIIIVISVNFITNTADNALEKAIVMDEALKEEAESLTDNIQTEVGDFRESEPLPEESEKDANSPVTIASQSKVQSLEKKLADPAEIEAPQGQVESSDIKKAEEGQVEVTLFDKEQSDFAVAAPSPPPVVKAAREKIIRKEDSQVPTAQDNEGIGFSRKKRASSDLELAEDSFTGKLLVSSISQNQGDEYVPLKEYQFLQNHLNNNININLRTTVAEKENIVIIELEFNERNKITSSKIIEGLDPGIDQQMILLLENFDQWNNYKDELKGKIKLKFKFGS